MEPEQNHSSDLADWVNIPRLGTVFIEARFRDEVDLQNNEAELLVQKLESQLFQADQVFNMGEDILAEPNKATLMLSESLYDLARAALASLRVVDYAGPPTDISCYSSNDTKIKIQPYQLYTAPEDRNTIEQAEITLMPHKAFEGQWDELVFEQDIKAELIRVMTNILRFSRKTLDSQSDMNPLVLLYGPPGTGKTTLCQALAQKISIRLSSTYKQTKLIQINTAALLSKYYGESAKQVHRVFSAIEQTCQENPDQFTCVLIDEVESIASSRESAMRGEAQDSLRATNALLTGLDRVKKHFNVIFLCTTNMYECLDTAFLDRCGHKLKMEGPRSAIQYEILRMRLRKLIANGTIISPVSDLPPYRDANLERSDHEAFGSKLLNLVDFIDQANLEDSRVSGRWLSQLPQKAVLLYLREHEECSLDMALEFVKKCILRDEGLVVRKGENCDDIPGR